MKAVSFNRSAVCKPSRGWNSMGADVPAGLWHRRSELGMLCGLYFNVVVPGSLNLGLAGSGSVKMDWGGGSGYAIKLRLMGKVVTSVFAAPGRYDLRLVGDVGMVTGFDGLASSALCGSLAEFVKMPLLEVLALEGTCVGGDIGIAAGMAGLRVFRMAGCTGCSYVPRELPDWPDGLVMDFSDAALSAESVNSLVRDLAATTTAGGELHIGGSNGAVGPTFMDFVALLEMRGWMVIHN